MSTAKTSARRIATTGIHVSMQTGSPVLKSERFKRYSQLYRDGRLEAVMARATFSNERGDYSL